MAYIAPHEILPNKIAAAVGSRRSASDHLYRKRGSLLVFRIPRGGASGELASQAEGDDGVQGDGLATEDDPDDDKEEPAVPGAAVDDVDCDDDDDDEDNNYGEDLKTVGDDGKVRLDEKVPSNYAIAPIYIRLL